MKYDADALGIALPGPMTWQEKRMFGYIKWRQSAWKSATGARFVYPLNGAVDLDFDDYPFPSDILAAPFDATAVAP